MKRHVAVAAVLAIVVMGLSGATWAATNETVEVQAKQKDNPQQNPSDIEGHFTQAPTSDKDEVHVTNQNIKGQGAGVYNDPINDGALLTITQQVGPVKVDVEGREGIGAMYWVTVIPTGGGGGGGEKTVLWADVEDIKRPGALVLKDKNSGQGESDLTDSDENTPELYCSRAEDGKGDVEFWLNTDSGTYSWAIKQGASTVASGTLNSDNEWKGSQSDLVVGWYTLEVTKSGEQNFKRRIDFGVVAITLFRNNTQWSADWVLTDIPDLFTVTTIAGIQIEGVGTGKTVQVKAWSSEDTDHKPTQTLTESSSTYRNSGTDVWPHFYTEYQENNKRLKITDETSRLYVLPILGGNEQAHLAKDQKVDLAEVAAVDGTDSLDAVAVYNAMTADPHNWCGIALYDKDHNKAQGTGAKCVELGAKVDLLNVSGHSFADANPVGVTGEDGYGLKTDSFTPSDIGATWDNGELEWLLLAVCSQVAVSDPANNNDNGIKWIKAMPKVHGLLGYRLPAPTDGVDVTIANDFCARLAPGGDYDHVHMAWMLANRPSTTNCRNRNASCLVRTANLDDKMYEHHVFPTADDPGNEYRYYWIEKEGVFDVTYRIYYRTFTLP